MHLQGPSSSPTRGATIQMCTGLTLRTLHSTGRATFQFLGASDIVIQFPLFIVDGHQTALLSLHTAKHTTPTKSQLTTNTSPETPAKCEVLTKEEPHRSFSWNCCRACHFVQDGRMLDEPTLTKIVRFSRQIYCSHDLVQFSYWRRDAQNRASLPGVAPFEQGTSGRYNRQ